MLRYLSGYSVVVLVAGIVLAADPKPPAPVPGVPKQTPKANPAPAKPAANVPKPAQNPPKPAPKPPIPPSNPNVLPAALKGALKDIEEVVFVARSIYQDPHWYANFAYWSEDANKKMWAEGGSRLCKLNLRTGKITTLINDPKGSIRDPALHYDAKKLLFSYRKGGTEHFNLYEINVDGTDLKQITKTDTYDDLEPTYLPNGDIIFVSSRCKRWVSCWFTQVAILHRCDANGQNIRPISGNIEQDNTPSIMPDGRVLYTRWEYIDRSQVEFHHLWTANPDGTNVQTFFGNMNPGIVMIDSKPIPGTGKVATIFSPGHGVKEHQGPLYIVTPEPGPDNKDAAIPVAGAPSMVHDPWPVNSSLFIAARKKEIVLIDSTIPAYQTIVTDEQELHEPIAIAPRPREAIIPDRANLAKDTGRLILSDIHIGRNMAGVKPGEIKKLLVLEALPKPINFSGGPEPLSWLGTFNLERVLGTVPVEPDGSAYMELPPNRSLFFVALDEKDLSVKRMQSFLSVMPGETSGCVGCHEQRTQSPVISSSLQALKRAPSKIQPFAGFPDVIDYPRDVQPIWDQHCVKCHSYDKPDGGIVLTGDRGPTNSHSFWMLFASRQIADGANGYGNRPPRAIGSSASPLMKKIDGSHYGAKLDDRQWRMVWMWIESSATYSGTYASLGCGMVGPAFPQILQPGAPARPGAEAILQKRCASCHVNSEDAPKFKNKVVLPAKSPPRRPGDAAHQRIVLENDPVLHRSYHILYNYTRPEKSIALLGPLANEAGGWGTCQAKSGTAVFKSADDPDYRHLLSLVVKNKAWLDDIKRFDMPGFIPNSAYLREMKRYGILSAGFDPAKDKIDPYQTDQAYWKSLWWNPTSQK